MLSKADDEPQLVHVEREKLCGLGLEIIDMKKRLNDTTTWPMEDEERVMEAVDEVEAELDIMYTKLWSSLPDFIRRLGMVDATR